MSIHIADTNNEYFRATPAGSLPGSADRSTSQRGTTHDSFDTRSSGRGPGRRSRARPRRLQLRRQRRRRDGRRQRRLRQPADRRHAAPADRFARPARPARDRGRRPGRQGHQRGRRRPGLRTSRSSTRTPPTPSTPRSPPSRCRTSSAKDVSVIVGAASSSVTRNVIDDITGAKIVQISPANTATDLSGYSDFYFRTAPPDTVQGAALANLIMGDGAVNPGIIVFNDDYGTSLRNVVEEIVRTQGAHAHLRHRRGQEFDPNETNFNTTSAARSPRTPTRSRSSRSHADAADRLRSSSPQGVRHVEDLLRRRQPHALR